MLDRYRQKTHAAKTVASQLAAEYHAGAGRGRGTPEAETLRSYARRRLETFLDVDHADVMFHLRDCVVRRRAAFAVARARIGARTR